MAFLEPTPIYRQQAEQAEEARLHRHEAGRADARQSRLNTFNHG